MYITLISSPHKRMSYRLGKSHRRKIVVFGVEIVVKLVQAVDEMKMKFIVENQINFLITSNKINFHGCNKIFIE